MTFRDPSPVYNAGMTALKCGTHTLDLSQPRVMGVLNVTPDSFSDGSRFLDASRAVDHAREMVVEGAAVIDIGGESTRPGAEPVSESDELGRVLPVIEALSGKVEVPLSIDTSKPAVMTAAVEAGAGFINDVQALKAPGALEAAASLEVPVCLMHMLGEPRTMQENPRYDDVVSDIHRFLEERMTACVKAGIAEDRLVLDPGFGFGKTLEHNLELLRRLNELLDLGRPLLIGISRKSMLGKLLDGAPPEERLPASLAAAVIAVWQGAAIVRAHDVGETVQALRVCEAARSPQIHAN